MTVSDLDVKQVFNGDGGTVTFPIIFDIRENSVVKVFLIDTTVVDASTPSGFAETEQFSPADFTFDATPIAANIIMGVAPTGTEDLRVIRVSPLNQGTDLMVGVDGEEQTELSLDRSTHIAQEQDDRINELEIITSVPASPTPVSAQAPLWVAGTIFAKDALVVNIDTLYRATVAHTADLFDFFTDFTAGKWQLLSGVQGEVGPQGGPGGVGPGGATGAPGSNGTNGAAGADGIFTAIASQGEAQAGVENTKGMTALRTKEAITFQVDQAGIVTNTSDIAAINISISELTSRVTILESLIQQATGKFAGQQVLLNNQVTPITLLGVLKGGQFDKGAGFSRQSSGTEFADVMVLFKRTTDTSDRFSTTDVVMQFVSGGWLIGRKGTEQLEETLELDGVTLSIDSVTGQVSYISDNMAGANHDTQSIIAWLGQEISKC